MTGNDGAAKFEGHLADEEATLELGRQVGRWVPPQTVLLLIGELGAGKTTFVRGFAEGLEIPSSVRVRSPSYQMRNSYEGGRLVLDHFDAYFMERTGDLFENGWHESLAAGHVIVVEWGDRLEDSLEDDRIVLEFQHENGSRRVFVRARGPKMEELCVRISSVL